MKHIVLTILTLLLAGCATALRPLPPRADESATLRIDVADLNGFKLLYGFLPANQIFHLRISRIDDMAGRKGEVALPPGKHDVVLEVNADTIRGTLDFHYDFKSKQIVEISVRRLSRKHQSLIPYPEEGVELTLWDVSNAQRVRIGTITRYVNDKGPCELRLEGENQANQAVEPSRTAVTSPAGAGDRASGAPGAP